MRFSNGRIIYDGIHETLNGKAAFMEKVLQYKAVQEEAAKRIANSKELREKLGCIETTLNRGLLMRLELNEKELEELWYAMHHKKYAKIIEDAGEEAQAIATPLLESEYKVDVDITYYIANAIVMNEQCRKKLNEVITDRGEYYHYWEKSDYNNPEFENNVPAEHIWSLRLIVGLIEKLRKEECHGAIYRLFMDIIYAGNRHLKRLFRGRHCLSGEDVKNILASHSGKSHDVFPIKCLIILAMVIAEDMNMVVTWDYEMMIFLQFYRTPIIEETELEEEELQKRDYSDFLKGIDEKFGSHNSMTELILSPVDHDIAILLFLVMAMYDFAPGKFAAYALTEEECEELLFFKEKWSQKKYEYILYIAQLCKYIYHLEQKYIEVAKDSQEYDTWKKKQEEAQNEKKEQQYQSEINRIQAEKKQMSAIIREQEQQISKLQKQLEASENQIQESTGELVALRSFVYHIGKEEEEESQKHESQSGTCESWKEQQEGKNETLKDKKEGKFDSGRDKKEGKIEAWKDKKVVVVGGHINWQNKLKEIFPRWQFLTSGQSALAGNVIRGKEIIVCNTMILDHSCYYKVISEKGKEQKLCYVHSNNIQKCIAELEAQME